MKTKKENEMQVRKNENENEYVISSIFIPT